jgi:hypothetical protein
MPIRLALIVAITASMWFFPMRLSAQQKYVGLSLCSPELQSPRTRYGIRLDSTQHAYVEYREMPTARVVMIVVYADDFGKDHCGSVRDAREFKYSKDVFVPDCIELLHPESVAVGFFDQKFDPDHLERRALMRGPAVQSWRIDLKNLTFLPTSGQVNCVVENYAGADDGSDLASWAHQRVAKKNNRPAR